MTFIPRILASASNAPKPSHCQTGKSLAVYKKLQKSQYTGSQADCSRLSGRVQQNFCHSNLSVSAGRTVDQRQLTAAGNGCKTTTLVYTEVNEIRVPKSKPQRVKCNCNWSQISNFLPQKICGRGRQNVASHGSKFNLWPAQAGTFNTSSQRVFQGQYSKA